MEIIKWGIDPGARWRGTCSICNTVALARTDELKIDVDQLDRMRQGVRDETDCTAFGRGTCPVCRKEGMIFFRALHLDAEPALCVEKKE